ncbi:heparinase II/III family protein [Paenibacillus koleovorans]|uniref:heparinase II/III family protein n=1 Tax=Paenibacillus koleovorans TaxID=121608 RepID=UPI0013E2ED8E|nr:heparinase II/III family protein [Paenibacillus koleovorans]
MQEHLYPVYPVHEWGSGRAVERSSKFLVADVQFRRKHAKLEETTHSISFQAYTQGTRLIVLLEYEHVASRGGDHGEVLLFFDRGSTRRKRHNLFVLRLKPDGRVLYEEHNYEAEQLPLPEGLICVKAESEQEGHERVVVEIPLTHLRIRSEEDRVIGFNAVRILKDPKDDPFNNLAGDFISWSGIKGDRPSGGVGNGDMLLTRGLNEAELAAWAEKVQTYGSTHYKQWERRWIPDDIIALMAEKRRGFTGRLSREDVERAKRKASTTDWGRRMRAGIVEIADYWAAKSDEELFDLVPTGNPRSLSVGQFFGNPLHGGKRTAFEVCLERPYEYYSIHTKSWWRVGMTLMNPETGEEVELEDDGGGFVAPDGFPVPGARYMFTASYRLFLISMLLGTPYCSVLEDPTICPETTGVRFAGAIPNLAFAYHLTGDEAYARKALVLLGRLGELIPYMNGNYGSGYYDTVQIAEPTTTECHWLTNYFDSLDLLYDTIDRVEGDLAAVFAGKPDAEGKERSDRFCLKAVVQDMIPFILYSCEIERTRTADWSLRYTNLELLLASFMESGKLMHHVLNVGGSSLKAKVRNNFFRDGRYHYDSLGYVVQICDQVTMMANNNYGFRDDIYFPQGLNLFENPEYGIRQVIQLYSRLYCGGLTPMFGDTIADNVEPISEDRVNGKFRYSQAFEIIFARSPSAREALGPMLAAFEDEELARYRTDSMYMTNVKHGLLLLATAGERVDYERYKGLEVEVASIQPSFLIEDSETSVLRAGTNPHNCKHVVLYGHPSAGHKHGDKLGLWIGAYGYHLFSPIGGYPFTWLSPKFDEWEVHSAACTVVIVDGSNQMPSYSRVKCHYEGELLQVSGMENTTAYPGTHYERWCLVVQAPDPKDAYVVDLNYLTGGRTFDYNTMGMDISFDEVEFGGEGAAVAGAWRELSGTMAGEHVELYSKPGLGWMQALRKLETDRPVSWTYRYAGAALKVHTAPEPGERREIVCALGERGGEEMRKSRWEPMVVWRDEADADTDTVGEESIAGHRAVYASVLEPHERDGSFIRHVRRLKLQGQSGDGYKPVGLEVVFADGLHRDIVIAVHGEKRGVASFVDLGGRVYETDAGSLLLRYRGDKLVEMEAVGYTRISDSVHLFEADAPAISGRVVEVDLHERRVEIELDCLADADFTRSLKGKVALLDSSDYLKPSTYYMFEPVLEGRRFAFRSDMSLIRMDADWKQPQKRLGLGKKETVLYEGREVYADVKPGDRFTLHHTGRFSDR